MVSTFHTNCSAYRESSPIRKASREDPVMRENTSTAQPAPGEDYEVPIDPADNTQCDSCQ